MRTPVRIPPARLAGVLLFAASPAMAAGAWDFYGSVGLNAGRADNPRFAAQRNPAFDPNAAICSDPSDPNYSASVCEEKFLPRAAHSGNTTGSLRLSGGVTGQWQRSYFDFVYAPTAYFYYQRAYLNQVGHDLVSTYRHNFTQRSSLNVSEYFNYTPEQDLDPNNLQQNNVITRRTSRLNSSLRGSYGVQHSAKTTLTWTYRNVIRSFSSPDFIDSANHNAGVQWKRRAGPGSFVSSGYEFGLFTFGRGISSSEHHQASVGYGFESARGLTLGLNAGYNVLVPIDPGIRRSSGLYANAALGWTGGNLAATAGYTRGFSDGGGAYVNAQTENTFADLRYAFTPKLSADVSATRNVHERLPGGSTAATSADTIRSFNGRGSVNYRLAKNLGINASFTQYRQGVPSASASVPEVRSNRYSIGLTWSIR